MCKPHSFRRAAWLPSPLVSGAWVPFGVKHDMHSLDPAAGNFSLGHSAGSLLAPDPLAGSGVAEVACYSFHDRCCEGPSTP